LTTPKKKILLVDDDNLTRKIYRDRLVRAGFEVVEEAAGANVHDVVCPWEVPDDIVAGSGVKFRVSAVVTNVAGPANQGLSFKLSGYSIGDNDPIGAAFGSEVEVTKIGLTAVQFDRLQTAYSGAVTVTDLAAGELAMLHFERDTADASDDYLKPVGVTGVGIKYEGLTAGF
jgi:hypothetical protein